MDDDFEIEVTNLNTGATTRHTLAPDPTDDPVENDDPGFAPKPSNPHKARGLRAAVVSGFLVVAVALVIFINPTAQSSLYSVLHFPTPAPTATMEVGANIAYLVFGAPWGKATLDGKPTEFVNLGQSSSWVMLNPGRHTLDVKQAPFPSLHCTISMPAAKRDTCPVISASASGMQQYGNGQIFPPASRIIDLGARFSRLPRDSHDALVALITAQLQPPSTSATLQPGDHYLRDDGKVAVAQTTLRATYIPTVLTPAESIPSDSQSCVSFCDISGINPQGSGAWSIMVAVLGSWRISTPDGTVIVNHSAMYPSSPLYENQQPSLNVMMNMLWMGAWQVSQTDAYGNQGMSMCQVADQLVSIATSTAQNSGMGMSFGQWAGKTPEQGCVVEVTPGDASNPSGPPSGHSALVLYHYGVLLAANDIARKLMPTLPIASANELAQAQQIRNSGNAA